MKTATCNRCGKEKLLTKFHKNNQSSSGVSSWCKKCRSKSRKIPKVVWLKNRQKHIDKMTVNALSIGDAAYLAGLVDGEGCIQMGRNHANDPKRATTYTLRVRITNTFPGLMDWVSKIVGHGWAREIKLPPGATKPAWEWYLTGHRAVAFLRQIHPYLIIKKLQAEVAFEYAETLGYPSRTPLTDEALATRNRLKVKLTALNK